MNITGMAHNVPQPGSFRLMVNWEGEVQKVPRAELKESEELSVLPKYDMGPDGPSYEMKTWLKNRLVLYVNEARKVENSPSSG